jgi:hypothetical protein
LFPEEVDAVLAGTIKATTVSHRRALEDATAEQARKNLTPRGASTVTWKVFLDISTDILWRFVPNQIVLTSPGADKY